MSTAEGVRESSSVLHMVESPNDVRWAQLEAGYIPYPLPSGWSYWSGNGIWDMDEGTGYYSGNQSTTAQFSLPGQAQSIGVEIHPLEQHGITISPAHPIIAQIKGYVDGAFQTFGGNSNTYIPFQLNGSIDVTRKNVDYAWDGDRIGKYSSVGAGVTFIWSSVQVSGPTFYPTAGVSVQPQIKLNAFQFDVAGSIIHDLECPSMDRYSMSNCFNHQNHTV